MSGIIAALKILVHLEGIARSNCQQKLDKDARWTSHDRFVGLAAGREV